LPADVAIFAAAVADWRAQTTSASKIKKSAGGARSLALAENADILATVAKGAPRPKLVIGFAAETDDLLTNAAKKLKAKGADWIVANDVSPEGGVMGGAENTVHIVSAADGVEDWPRLSKEEVARLLMERVADTLAKDGNEGSVSGRAASGARRGAAAARGANG
jgi:phosphopantothenoylcysteine decarboxylase/phosphopantothenate--cysteine ligase